MCINYYKCNVREFACLCLQRAARGSCVARNSKKKKEKEEEEEE